MNRVKKQESTKMKSHVMDAFQIFNQMYYIIQPFI